MKTKEEIIYQNRMLNEQKVNVHYIPRLKPKFEILPPSRELQNNG